MKAARTRFILVTFILLPLLLLRCKSLSGSDTALVCHDGFMSIFIANEQFADLPFAIYIQGKSQH